MRTAMLNCTCIYYQHSFRNDGWLLALVHSTLTCTTRPANSPRKQCFTLQRISQLRNLTQQLGEQAIFPGRTSLCKPWEHYMKRFCNITPHMTCDRADLDGSWTRQVTHTAASQQPAHSVAAICWQQNVHTKAHQKATAATRRCLHAAQHACPTQMQTTVMTDAPHDTRSSNSCTKQASP
jgi:hypothetical protein